MTKVRIYEIAKQLGIDNKVVVQKAKELGLDVKNHMSSVEDSVVTQIKSSLNNSANAQPAKPTKNEKRGSKIKISISSIRKPEKSAEQPKPRTANRRRPQTDRNHRPAQRRDRRDNRPTANKPKTAARDLLKQLQQNQRAEAGKLNQMASQAKAEYHQHLNHKPAAETDQPAKTSANAQTQITKPAAKSTTTERVIGPKILKPSPARLKTRHSTSDAAAKVAASATKAPQPATGDRKKATGFAGRKSRGTRPDAGRSAHSDKSERRRRKNNKRRRPETPKKAPTVRKDKPLPAILSYEEGMNAQDIAKLIHREPAEIVKKLFMLGIMTNQNQSLDKDTIELLAAEYGIEAQAKVHEDISDIDHLYEKLAKEATESDSQTKRPPVVTIMGHVDHGKTTLLDRLRHTNVSAHEAGGITQKIGAYQVRLDDRLITFLDTPGHAAFSNMRARGAEVTDIVILVVAADDGVMPQTIEAIDHAKNAHVPLIVAINKMDVPGANPQHVTEQLMKYNLIPEQYGGDTIYVNISAKTGENVDDLLQMILLQADVLELKSNSKQKAIGTVVEARLSRGRGPVADILVQAGTLHDGDPIVVGNTFGRVRVMTNDRGHQVKKATPSMPVEITGLNDVPESADKLVVFDDEKTARAVGEARAQQALLKSRENVQHVTLDNLFDTMKRENMKEVDIVLKADVQGSVEALQQALEKIEVEGVRVNIIHAGAGAINESDVTLAGASNAFIIGFNVRPTLTAKSQAENDGVDVRLYSIIYKAIDDVTAAMKGMLEPTYEEKVIGNLTVREIWKVSKVGTIAGAFVDSGRVTSDASIRLIRDGIVIYDGKVGSLKRFKDDVKEVKQNFDCGLTIEGYNDIKVDDQLEAYEMQEVTPS
ncbi:MAG: translation initiation factor IF-2 [Lactobacillus sp.]